MRKFRVKLIDGCIVFENTYWGNNKQQAILQAKRAAGSTFELLTCVQVKG